MRPAWSRPIVVVTTWTATLRTRLARICWMATLGLLAARLTHVECAGMKEAAMGEIRKGVDL